MGSNSLAVVVLQVFMFCELWNCVKKFLVLSGWLCVLCNSFGDERFFFNHCFFQDDYFSPIVVFESYLIVMKMINFITIRCNEFEELLNDFLRF